LRCSDQGIDGLENLILPDPPADCKALLRVSRHGSALPAFCLAVITPPGVTGDLMPIASDSGSDRQRQSEAAPFPVIIAMRRRPASERAGEPGFVRRFEGFEEVKAMAESFAGTHHAKIVILAAVRSMPGLTPAERQVLAEAVDSVPRADYTTPKAGIVYPRNRVFADRCGLRLSTVKAAKAGLERKALAIRHIAGDNNGAKLDIRPFLADIDRHIAHRIELDEARRQDDSAGAAYQTIEVDEDRPGGLCTSPHIQSPITPCESVPTADEGKTASAGVPEPSTTEPESAFSADESPKLQPFRLPPTVSSSLDNGTCSPGGACGSFGDFRRGHGIAETARAALTEAYQHGTALLPYIGQPEIDRLDLPALYAGAERAVEHWAKLLPERNIGHTWEWAVKRLGWRAIIVLIVALDDPSIRDRQKWFGAFASGKLAYPADGFRSNFQRMDRAREEETLAAAAESDPAALTAEEPATIAPAQPAGDDQAAAEAPIAGTATPGTEADWTAHWPVFLAALAALVGPAPFKHFFASGAPGEILELALPTSLAANWIQQNHADDIRKAAIRIGWRCVRVQVKAA
jgi:hypothetical protein